MTMHLRRIEDLDLEDHRRSVRPKDDYCKFLWDRGLVSVTPAEYFDALTEKLRKEGMKPGRSLVPFVEQKQCSWYRSHPFLKRKAKPPGYHPYCTMGVHTYGSDAQPPFHSADRSCNSCGITHWRRHCPLNRDEGVPETAPKLFQYWQLKG